MAPLLQLVRVVGLVDLLVISLLVGVYAAQILWRVLRFWKESAKKPPPAAFRGSLFGLSWQIEESVEKVSEEVGKMLTELDRRVKVLERKEMQDILRELARRRALRGPE